MQKVHFQLFCLWTDFNFDYRLLEGMTGAFFVIWFWRLFVKLGHMHHVRICILGYFWLLGAHQESRGKLGRGKSPRRPWTYFFMSDLTSFGLFCLKSFILQCLFQFRDFQLQSKTHLSTTLCLLNCCHCRLCAEFAADQTTNLHWSKISGFCVGNNFNQKGKKTLNKTRRSNLADLTLITGTSGKKNHAHLLSFALSLPSVSPDSSPSCGVWGRCPAARAPLPSSEQLSWHLYLQFRLSNCWRLHDFSEIKFLPNMVFVFERDVWLSTDQSTHLGYFSRCLVSLYFNVLQLHLFVHLLSLVLFLDNFCKDNWFCAAARRKRFQTELKGTMIFGTAGLHHQILQREITHRAAAQVIWHSTPECHLSLWPGLSPISSFPFKLWDKETFRTA